MRKPTPESHRAAPSGLAKDDFHRGRVRAATSGAHRRLERLTAVQAATGFSTQELSEVLDLSRSQLYRCFDAGDDYRLPFEKGRRFAIVERIARAWRELSDAPLCLVVHERLSDGSRLFLRLTAYEIDEAAAHSALNELATKLPASPQSRSQRLVEAGFTRRPSVRSLPSDE